MAYDIPSVNVKIEPFKDDDSDLKSLMQLALMQQRMAKAASGGGGGSGRSGGGGTKGDVYYMPDPESPGRYHGVFVPGDKTAAIKYNLAAAQDINNKAITNAFFDQNPGVKDTIAGLDQFDVATQNAKLKELRETVVPDYAKKHGLTTEQALGIFDAALAPTTEAVAQRTREVRDASRVGAVVDSFLLNVKEAWNRVTNAADSDQEILGHAQDYVASRQKLIEENAYLRDRAKAEAQGKGLLERSSGVADFMAEVGMNVSDFVPSVLPPLAGGALGSVGGPAGALAGAAAASAATTQFDYATMLQSNPNLTDEQRREAFSSGRPASIALGGALGAIPGGVGRAAWEAARSGLTRAGLTSVGRQAAKAGKSYADDLLAQGATQAAARAGGQRMAQRVISDAAAQRAADAARSGWFAGYRRNLPLTAAEMGTMNVGSAVGMNAIMDANGVPTNLGEGAGAAFLTGVASAPLFGIFNARYRPTMPAGYDASGSFTPSQLQIGASAADAGATPAPAPVGSGGAKAAAPAPSPSETAVASAAMQRLHLGVSDLVGQGWRSSERFQGLSDADASFKRVGDIGRAVEDFLDNGGTPEAFDAYIAAAAKFKSADATDGKSFINAEDRKLLKDVFDYSLSRRRQAATSAPSAVIDVAEAPTARAPRVDRAIAEAAQGDPAAVPLLESLRNGLASLTGKDWQKNGMFLGLATDTKVSLREQLAAKAYGDFRAAGGTPELFSRYVDAVRNGKGTAKKDAAFLSEVAAEYDAARSAVTEGLVTPPTADAPIRTAPEMSAPVEGTADAARPAVEIAAGRDVAAGVGESGLRTAPRVAAPAPDGDSGVAPVAPRDVEAVTDVGAARVAGDSQPVEGGGAGGRRPADAVESATSARAGSAEGARPVADTDGGPGAATAAGRNAAAGVRAGERGDATSARAGSASADGATGTFEQPVDRAIADAVASKQAVDEAVAAAAAIADSTVVAPKVKTPRATRKVPSARKAAAGKRDPLQADADTGLIPPLPGANYKPRPSVPEKVVSPQHVLDTMAGLELRKFNEICQKVFSQKDAIGAAHLKFMESVGRADYKNNPAVQQIKKDAFAKVNDLLVKEWAGALSGSDKKKLAAIRKVAPELDAAIGLPRSVMETKELADRLLDVSSHLSMKDQRVVNMGRRMASVEVSSYMMRESMRESIRERLNICL